MRRNKTAAQRAFQSICRIKSKDGKYCLVMAGGKLYSGDEYDTMSEAGLARKQLYAETMVGARSVK